ncbi:serine hydrolase domain-containing protein [Streptoverticillium reticulum]|uniref:serine hydrolase domain-containing protein n=1 Tax=Streptoverticillium reticulum TaxID=1433415 RepID=UPI0039BF3833
MPKRRPLRTVLPAVLAAVLTGAGLSAAPPVSASRPAGHAATRAVMGAIVRGGVPGVLGRAREAGRIWTASSGVADLRNRRAPRPGDRFRIGSNTKTFVATVVLQLEAEHRLALGDTVEHWLPGVVHGNGHDGSRITVRQLLNHTSGIFNYTDDPVLSAKFFGKDFPRHRFDTYRPRELVRTAMAHRPVFAPGTGWSYSNTNYILAGMIIEKVTGHSYATEIRHRIIKRLGLHSTIVPGTSPRIPRPAEHGYMKLPGESPGTPLHDVTAMNPSVAGSAGEMISSAGDLQAFYRALLRGRLLPKRQLDEMLTTVDTGIRGIGRYGLGIDEQRLSCGTTVWGHGGGIPGFLSLVNSTRDAGHTAVFSVNAYGFVFDIFALLEAEFCGKAPAPQARAVPGAPAPGFR